MRSLCVFCGSQTGNDPVFEKSARAFGQLLASEGLRLVYGGGNIGLMGLLADAVLEKGGEVVGVIPGTLFKKEVAHTGLTALHRVGSMHERKMKMYELSDGFVALPGGLGTLEEFFEIVTWFQLGLHVKPCGILNVDGYFGDLLAFLDRGVRDGFVKQKHRRLILVEDDPKVLLKRLFQTFQVETGSSVS